MKSLLLFVLEVLFSLRQENLVSRWRSSLWPKILSNCLSAVTGTLCCRRCRPLDETLNWGPASLWSWDKIPGHLLQRVGGLLMSWLNSQPGSFSPLIIPLSVVWGESSGAKWHPGGWVSWVIEKLYINASSYYYFY